eukprot:Pgem_evm1s16029
MMAQLFEPKAEERILILTANGTSLTEPLQGLFDESSVTFSGLNGWKENYHVLGLENVENFGKEVAEGLRVHYEIAKDPILDTVKNYIEEIEKSGLVKVSGILSECTELPQFSDYFRKKLGLPVYDSITMTNYVHDARIDWTLIESSKLADFKVVHE